MANIRANQKNGKTISYRFTICLGRDATGKQLRKYTTWIAPEDMTPAKARKAAERAADAWELEVKAEYQAEQDAKAQGQAYVLPPEKRRDDFVSFVHETWFPLQVQNGKCKSTLVRVRKNQSC